MTYWEYKDLRLDDLVMCTDPAFSLVSRVTDFAAGGGVGIVDTNGRRVVWIHFDYLVRTNHS